MFNTEFAFSLNSTMPNHLTLDALPGTGTIKSVFHARITGLSTEIKSVSQFLINAKLTQTMVLVSHASRDTILRMEPVSSPHSIMLSLPIQDVPHGIGTTKFAFPAPNNGLSMPTKSAFQFPTNAQLTLIMEPASHASRDTIFRMEPVYSHHSTTPSPLIQDVLTGIGIIKSVFHALRTGFSMEIRNASQYLTNALLTLIMEPVFHASRDTILRTEPASSLISIMPTQPTLAVLHGIGTIKSAFPAQRDGSSTRRRDVYPLMTTVTVTMIVELVLHASSDTP